VVSNLPLAQLQPELEKRFGNWAAPAAATGTKQFTSLPPRPTKPKILLVDRPGAPQSTIAGGQLIPLNPRGDTTAFFIGNQVLGGDFLSRLNMDLREAKGWSYGVRGNPSLLRNSAAYSISAPVQADRTADAIVALDKNVREFLTTRGTTQEELGDFVASAVNELPGQFETSSSLLGGMMRNDLLDRPDDYYVRLPTRYRSLTTDTTNAALRSTIDPNGFVWVVVGDAAKLRPQLAKLGMPIETVEAP
jgi:predicted Zn-dependent peptidase